MKYLAYCVQCGQLEQALPSGVWIEAVAKNHKEKNPTHKVFVGYEV